MRVREGRLLRKIIGFFVLFIYLFDANTRSEEFVCLPSLANYRSEFDQMNVSDIRFNLINNDSELSLDGEIRSVAISQDGTIAIISSSTKLHDGKDVISLYSSDGNLMCRYQYSVNDKRGKDLVFFAEGNFLCYYVSHNTENTVSERSIIVLSQDGSGIIEWYTIPDVGVLIQFGVETVNNTPYVITDARSDISLTKIEDARLTVHNSRNDEDYVIYDFEQAFLTHQRETRTRQILFVICFFVVICIVIFTIEIRDNV